MGNPLKIPVSDRLKGTEEYYFSQKLREIEALKASGKEIINLGIGGPDLPPAAEVIEALQTEAAKPTTHSYQPNKGTAMLRGAFAEWYGTRYGVALDAATQVLPLMGSKEGIMDVCMAYLNQGDKVLIPNPGYPAYRSAVSLSGGVCVEYKLEEEKGWMPDFEAMKQAGIEGVKMMIANYPHMPTGTIPTDELFRRMIDFARENNLLILHDNPYSFIRNPEPRSILAVEGAIEVAVELNSLSKSHCMAGWRVGMLAGAKERIDETLRFRSNMDSGMFYPVQVAAAKALALPDEWYDGLNRHYYERQGYARNIMDILGCTYAPDQAGLFVWGRLPKGGGDGYACSDRILYDCGVFITPGGIFGSQGENYIRISLCAPVDVFKKAVVKISDR